MIVLRKILNLVGLASVIFCFSIIASAQQSNGRQVAGKVKGVTIDFLGPGVPNVNVVFEGTQENRKVVSNEIGEFEIELPAGEYRVTVAQFGIFDPFKHKKLKVKAGKVKKLDVVLKYDTKNMIRKNIRPFFDSVLSRRPRPKKRIKNWCGAVRRLKVPDGLPAATQFCVELSRRQRLLGV